MRLRIDHTTRYQFSRPVAHGLQRLRLTPKATSGQTVIDWSMRIDGAAIEVEYDDHNCNRTTLISVNEGAEVVGVHCTGLVVTAQNHGVIGHHSGHMPLWGFLEQSQLTKPGPRMRAIVAKLADPGGEALPTLHALSEVVRGAIAYRPGETAVHTTGEEAAALGMGVCQDHAHVFIGAARLLGIPARYVSGYLMLDERIHQDAGHAWAEAHVVGLGWVGFDVSNGISPDERYVRVATGRDYAEAAPITGLSYGSGESQLTVKLAVEQQHPDQ